MRRISSTITLLSSFFSTTSTGNRKPYFINKIRKRSSLILIGVLTVSTSHFAMASTIPNKYIVVFKDQQLTGPNQFTIAQSGESVRSAAERLINEAKQNQILIQNQTGTQSSVTNELDSVYEYALKGFSAQLTPQAVTYMSNEPEIDYVIADQTTELHTVQVSPPSWGLDRIDQANLPLDQSYEYLNDGSTVHAYIVDTGIRASHSEFTGRIGLGFDAIDGDNNPVDCRGHGTHVAGTVAGTNYGVAKNVEIHPVRIFGCPGQGTFADAIEGINWILANLQLPAVANMSFGGGIFPPADAAVNNLINAGVTTVISAGNDSGGSACNKSPARVANAITVASSTISDQRSSFSNIGPCVDIFAPGSSIRSAWHTSNNALNTISGTSMSAPHVTGVAALHLDENAALTPAQVSNMIIGNATLNRISNAGAGTPNRLLFSNTSTGGTPQTFTSPRRNNVLLGGITSTAIMNSTAVKFCQENGFSSATAPEVRFIGGEGGYYAGPPHTYYDGSWKTNTNLYILEITELTCTP